MSNLNNNFQVSGTLNISGIIPDIQLSSADKNILIKKEDGYYVKQPDTVLPDLSIFKTSIDNATSMASTALAASYTVESITDLKAIEPSTSSITHIRVKSYIKDKNVGGGYFYYDSADRSTASDGSTVIVTAKGARWKRIIEDQNMLNVTHFGALPDGATDCTDSCIAMYKWSQKYNARLGIQFPAGTFKLNGFDISASNTSTFRMVGAMVSYGYFPATTLVSDRTSGPMVKVKARWSEVANFFVDGETDKAANTKGFFENIGIEGQFVRMGNLRFKNVGGLCISLIDTLDTKIDQFYASNCSGGVIRATWSGSKTGSWDHTTACELSNFNIQNCKSDVQVLDMQRCTQSFIYNGWIEKTTNPGDLSNGGWIIDGLSMEDCVNPLNMTFCKFIMKQKNFQGTSAITTSDPAKVRWLSIWEDGSTEMMHHGFKSTGSMNYGFLTSENRFSNNSATSGWVKVGSVFVPNDGDTVNIRILGSLGFSSSMNTNEVANGRHGNGEATIRIQKKSSAIGMTWEGQGSCAVQDVMYVSTKTDCTVYVKLGPYVMNSVAIIETSAKDRFYAGVCFRWTFDGSKMAEADVLATPGIVQALGQASWSAGNNGIVLSADGSIGIKTLPIENNQLPLYINGVLYKIALTK